jgi:hypothetical protein
MIICDIHHKITKTGVFATMAGLADLHMLIDTDDKSAYQPLNHDSMNYLKHCMDELRASPKAYGKIYTFLGGDTTELDNSGTRKIKRAIRKNIRRAEDSIHRAVLSQYVIPKIKRLTQGTKFIGGIAGNHLIEFSDESGGDGYPNSEAYVIRKLGGIYAGEGLMLINLNLEYTGGGRCLKKIVIMHGSKGGTKTSIIKELERLHSICGKVDMLIKAHAHDPSAFFCCRYEFPNRESGDVKTHECVVMCLGSTRDGIKKGYDDYTERFLYPPTAARFPMAVFVAQKMKANQSSLDIKIRPLIM